MNRYHLLCCVLVLANAGMGYRVSQVHGRAAAPELPRLPAALARMDSFDGARLDAASGKPAVLAFVGGSDRLALDSVAAAVAGTPRDGRRFVLFSDEPSRVKERLRGLDAAVVRMTNGEWLSFIRAATNLETWHVYDELGVLRAKGDFAFGGLQGALEKVLGTAPGYSSALLSSRLQSLFAPDGSGFSEAEPLQLPAGVVLFIGRVMSGCPIATALHRMNEAAERSKGVSFTVLVPTGWRDDEIRTLKTNFSVRIPVTRAPAPVTAAWTDLERTYGSGATAGFLVRFRTGHAPEVFTEATPLLEFLGRGGQ